MVIWESIVALVQQHVMDHAFMTYLNDRLNLSSKEKHKLGLLQLFIVHEVNYAAGG